MALRPRMMPAAAVLLLGVLAAAPAAAQRVTAAIDGFVRDATGAAIADARVTARNRETGLQRDTTTDANGRFVVVSLPDGEYELRADHDGFAPAVQSDVVLRIDETRTVEFTLTVAAQTTIIAAAPGPAASNAVVGVLQVVDDALVDALPVPRRGFLALASLAAGFTGNPDFPYVQGQPYWANQVLVDGGSHFSKWRTAARAYGSGYPIDAVREIDVLTNAFSAEFGDALASITRVSTRSGTNNWQGSTSLFVRDDAWSAQPVFAPRTPPSSGQQFAVSVGGPLRRDRTHLFAAYDGRRARDTNIVVSPVAPNTEVPDDQNEHLLFVRVDQQTRRGVVALRYDMQQFRWHNEPGGIVLPGSGTQYDTTMHTVLITGAHQLSAHTPLEWHVQFASYTEVRRDLLATPLVSRVGYALAGGSLGPAGYGVDPERAWEGGVTATHWRGNHIIRAGVGGRIDTARTFAQPYGFGAYFYAGPATTPYLFRQTLADDPGDAIANPRSVAAFGFVQDDWSMRRRIRVGIGARYDIEQLSRVRGIDVPADRNNIQPRVAASWQVTDSGRTVVHGGVGVYTQQQLLYHVARVAIEGDAGTVPITLLPGDPLFPSGGPLSASRAVLPPHDVQRLSPDFRNPYSWQTAVGVEHAFLGGRIAADFVSVRGRDLPSLIDANAPASLLKPATRTVAEADATRPLPPVPGGLRRIVILGNEGRSWYRALQAKFERSTGQLHAIASYTVSRAEDMANYVEPEDSRDLQADKGPADADVPHSISAGASWRVPGMSPLIRGWSLSAILSYRSSRPYTISWGDDRTGTTQNDARPGGRNTARTAAYRTVDLSVTRRFTVGPTSIEARADVFNLLNAVNYDRYVGQLLSPLFGQPVSAFPPRRIELAAVARF